MTVFEMAKKYYPLRWSKNRIDALYDAGKLTKEEYEEIIKESTPDESNV